MIEIAGGILIAAGVLFGLLAGLNLLLRASDSLRGLRRNAQLLIVIAFFLGVIFVFRSIVDHPR